MLYARRVTTAIATTLALVALTAQADCLSAQGTIRGTVTDSLRAGGPMPGAVVVLAEAGVQTTADARGQFEFRGVMPGHYTLTHAGPHLDSLGLGSVVAETDVVTGKTANVALSTPSISTYSRVLCGGTFHEDYGVLRGHVRRASGAAVPQANLAVEWLETLMMPGLNEDRIRVVNARTNSSGSFIFCGVPRNLGVVLTVNESGTPEISRLRVQLDEFVTMRDVLFTPKASQLTVTAKIVESEQHRALGAAVAADLVGGNAIAHADSSGSLQFKVNSMSKQILFRALGYTPIVRDIEPGATSIDLGVIELPRAPVMLATVSINSQAVTMQRVAFDERKKNSWGAYLDDNLLARASNVTPAFVAGQQSIVRTVTGEQGHQQLAVNTGGRPCTPRFFVDGADNGAPGALDQELFLKLAKRIEIYNATLAPREFYDTNHCGSVVIWTW